MKPDTQLRSGDWVRVRDKDEIMRTLDSRGRLDGLPFMPEMFEFCGKEFRVFKRAHKTCDPPNGVGGRRMPGTVHLEGSRCDGRAHGDCQARCLLFWKEAWLVRLNRETDEPFPRQPAASNGHSHFACTESDVLAATRLQPAIPNETEPVYVCQSTQIAQATTPLPWWDVRQYIEDYRSGNAGLSQLAAAFLFFVYSNITSAGIGLGAACQWLYDTLQRLRGGTPYPLRAGEIARGETTPAAKLNLQPGELVKVRSYRDILATLDEDMNNRGMYFDAEMVPFCGKTYRVLARVKQIINEKTGRMQHMKNECIILDDVVCRACYAKNRRFCPRSIYPYWREIWLERVAIEPLNACDELRVLTASGTASCTGMR